MGTKTKTAPPVKLRTYLYTVQVQGKPRFIRSLAPLSLRELLNLAEMLKDGF